MVNDEPITLFAFSLLDSVYLLNETTNTICTYNIHKSGFVYAVTRYEEIDYIKYKNVITANKNTRALKTSEFNEIVNQLTALQDQAHTLRPLVGFDDFMLTIINKWGLQKPN